MKGIIKTIALLLTATTSVAMLGALSLTASAESDLTVTIDTGASVTLKDTDGDGYYEIGNADELYAFAAAFSGGNSTINVELTENITVNTSVLNENGELKADESNFRTWKPLGTSNKPYLGIFDGANHFISGLYYNNPDETCGGLIGCCGENGIVRGVGVIDSYFVAKGAVGGVVGYNKKGTVENCYSSCYIVGNGNNTGGVVGNIYYGLVKNCYSDSTVRGVSYVGGVVGINCGGSIENSWSTSKVSGSGLDIGGVLGESFNGGSTTNCYHNKSVFSGNSIADDSGTSSNVEGKYAESFANGEVAYLLGSAWGQEIGKDAYPVLGGADVYKNKISDCMAVNVTYEYSNEEKADVIIHTDSSTDNDHLCDYGCNKVIEECTPSADDGDCTTDINCLICGKATTPGAESHTGGSATCTSKAKCEACGKEYGEILTHTGGSATCTSKAKCEACGKEYGEILTHTYSTEFKSDATSHWNECVCTDKSNIAPHTDVDYDGACDVCGHSVEINDPSAPTPDLPEPGTPIEDQSDVATEETKKTDKADDTKKFGCGASASLSALAIIGLVSTALVIKKKEE